VIYETKNFLMKNDGSLHADLEQILKVSKIKFFSSMFTANDGQDEEETKYGQTGGRFKSVGGKFQSQLTNLMTILGKTTSHFIRCIKPNGKQKPDLFVSPEVMTQLRYSGMCTALILMQAGFPTRISFEDLYERYSAKMPPAIARLKPITFCEALLVALDLNGGKDFQMGLTKVFFRSGKLQFLDDLMSDSTDAITAVVGKVKKWLARKRFHAAIWAVVSINRFGKLIDKVRLVRRFRRAVRFHVRGIRIWVACLNGVRKRIYSEAILAKKREEEERRKEAERLAEQQRREEEERRKREEEEARLKAEEEARRKAEEIKRKEEEARKALENKMKELQEGNSSLETKLSTVAEAKEQALNQIGQLNSKVEKLNTEITSLESKTKEQENKLRAEIDEKTKALKSLEQIQNLLELESQKSQGLEKSLKLEKEALASLQTKLETERANHKKELETLLASSETDKDKVFLELQKTLAEKTELETKLSDETEQRKSVEAKNSRLEEDLKNEKLAFANYKEESNKKMNSLQEEFKQYREENEEKIQNLETNLKNETNTKIEHQNKISDMEVSHKASMDLAARQKASLESQLSDEKTTNEDLRDQINKLKEELVGAHLSIENLSKQNRHLEEVLSKERDLTATLTRDLAAEKAGRQEDNGNSKKLQEETEKKARNDIALKQAVIDSISIDKKKTEEKLATVTDFTSKKISDLENKLTLTEDKVHSLDDQVTALSKSIDEKNARLEHLEREKVNLIDIAVKCQEAQFKLRNVYEKFPKELDLVRLLFGDTSFNTALRGNSIYGVLQKQGGDNTKKWAERHFILNDTFLFYFAAKGDKEPRGIIRMDLVKSIEKVDLSSLGKQHTFKISLRTGRDYFVSAASTDDCDKWFSLLFKLVP